MALETLKGVSKIGGFRVLENRITNKDGSVNWAETDEARKECPIFVDHDVNMVSFRIQNGQVKEVGVNGCQVDTVIAAAKVILEGLNKNFPCRENSMAITKLDEALMWLEKRKADRIAREVEGFNKA